MPYNFVPDSFHTGVTAEVLPAKIDRKSAILPQRGQFDPQFQVEGVAPPIIFAQTVRPMNALQPCHWQFSHKKNYVADFLQAKCDFTQKTAVLRFWTSLGGGLTGHRTMITGMRVVDFSLVLFELFSLGVTAEALRAKNCWKLAISLQRVPVDPKFQVEGVAPHQPFFF